MHTDMDTKQTHKVRKARWTGREESVEKTKGKEKAERVKRKRRVRKVRRGENLGVSLGGKNPAQEL